MTKFSYLEDGYRHVSAGMTAGRHERKGAITHSIDYAGRCSSPVTFERVYRSEKDVRWSINGNETERSTLYVDYQVPCRRCDYCLAKRSRLWRVRSEAEYELASRTWFGTLTTSPYQRMKLDYARDIALAKRGVSIDSLNEDERFIEQCKALGALLTKMLKRVRKNTKARFRHVAVFERHVSGDPHVHLLIFESDPLKPITKRELEAQWTHIGFSKYRLAKSRGVCGYITKYLTKDKTTRVRASRHFGEGAADRVAAPVTQPSQKNSGSNNPTYKNDPTNAARLVA